MQGEKAKGDKEEIFTLRDLRSIFFLNSWDLSYISIHSYNVPLAHRYSLSN